MRYTKRWKREKKKIKDDGRLEGGRLFSSLDELSPFFFHPCVEGWRKSARSRPIHQRHIQTKTHTSFRWLLGEGGREGVFIKRSRCWATSTMTTTQSPPKTCQPRSLSLSLTQRAELLLAASRIINTAGLCSLFTYTDSAVTYTFCQVYQSPTNLHDFLGVAMEKGLHQKIQWKNEMKWVGIVSDGQSG